MATDTEIREGNRLIAEFMKSCSLGDGVSMGLVDIAKYHSSWDWLMPVVEKIEAMDSRDIDCRISIEKDTCNIYYNNKGSEYEFNLWCEKNKIVAVWQSVVQFIKWYNSQPPISK